MRVALWSLTIIVISGAAVRLTGSGLGCSDWPNCEEDQFVASLEFHSLIEFGNRLFTGVVTVAVMLAVLGSLRRTPRDHALVWWSWGLVAGVIAQILLGAVLVLTHLDPRFTMGHFLLSMVLLWNAPCCSKKPRPTSPTRYRSGWARRRITTARSATQGTLFVFGSILLVTGTIVTGSGRTPAATTNSSPTASVSCARRDSYHSITAFTVLAVVLVIIRVPIEPRSSRCVSKRCGS